MAENFDSALGTPDLSRGRIRREGTKLVPPKNIIPKVAGAREIFWKYRYEALRRIQLYAQIEGLIAGNPPFNPVELAKYGLSHIANFNPLDSRALFKRAATAYWNLLNRAETLIKFELRTDDPQGAWWGECMARNWDLVVREWRDFVTNVNTLTSQLVKFGLSPLIWPDERSWKFKTVELQRFYITDQALTELDSITTVCVETFFTAQFLFQVYEEYKDNPNETDWDIKELESFLLWRANTWSKTDTSQFMDLMDLQRRIQNGDVTFDVVFSDNIRLVSLFQVEYDGKVTHYIFDRFFDTGSFLFKADRQYDRMDQVFMIYTASPGEFTIHSNRGVGHEIFSSAQVIMQGDCSIADMSRMSSTPLIRSPSTGAKDFEQIRFYPGVVTNIGSAEFVQNNLGSNIAQLVNANQYFLQKMNYNAANAGDDPSMPDRDQGSLSDTQAKHQSFREFSVLSQNIAHFYEQMDFMFRNMVLRMLHSKKGDPDFAPVKRWKELCKEDGVPDMFLAPGPDTDVLPKTIRKVSASRVVGDGSTVAHLMALEELQPIMGAFDTRAQREYQRQYVLATMGKEFLPVFIPPSNQADETSGGASVAGLENAIMNLGQSPVFSSDNDHQAHAATHAALGQHMIQQIEAGQMTPVDADKVFVVLIPHDKQHIDALASNPLAAGFYESIKKSWGELEKYAILNHKTARTMMEAQAKQQSESQAQTQTTMTDAERKDFQAQKDEQRKDLKVQSQVVRAKDANETRAGVMKDKVRSDADLKRLQIELEHENNQTKTQNDIQLDNAEAIQNNLEGIEEKAASPFGIEG